MDLSKWQSICYHYDRRAYLRMFELEWRVLGVCPLLEQFKSHRKGSAIGQCAYDECAYDEGRPEPGMCDWLGLSWYHACICGPMFIEKYNIPMTEREEDTYEEEEQ